MLFHFHLPQFFGRCVRYLQHPLVQYQKHWWPNLIVLSLSLLSLCFTHSGLRCCPSFGANSSSFSQVGLSASAPLPYVIFCSLSLCFLWRKVPLLQGCCVTVFLLSVIFIVEQTYFCPSVCQHVCHWTHNWSAEPQRHQRNEPWPFKADQTENTALQFSMRSFKSWMQSLTTATFPIHVTKNMGWKNDAAKPPDRQAMRTFLLASLTFTSHWVATLSCLQENIFNVLK